MVHPAGRMLAVLELLQTYSRVSGPEIAARLRDVREKGGRERHELLQDLKREFGPVDPTAGPAAPR